MTDKWRVFIAAVALAVAAVVASPSPASAASSIQRCHFTGSQVWLTFDDGVTTSVLPILAKYNVKAIFFIHGSWARAYPGEVQKVLNAGHYVGNHTSTHARLTTLTDAQVLAEINGGPRGNMNPPLLRPPFGAYDQRIVNLAASRGYKVCTWTVASTDSSGASAATIIAKAKTLQAGGVFIMHSKYANTRAALPGVIAAIRAKGLTLAGLG